MSEFKMPSLGADMDRGVLLEWRVKPGDRVAKGDIVAVIDTEKSDIEVEIFHGGIIGELLVPEGQEVEVGTVLATVLQDDDATPAPGAAASPAPVAAASPAPVTESHHDTPLHSPIVRHLAQERGIDLDSVRGTGPGGAITRADIDSASAPPRPEPEPAPTASGSRARSSPLARHRAAELGVDLSTVSGTGPDGAITVHDVEATSGQPAVRPGEPATRPARSDRSDTVRAATGRLMARSKREIPHYYLSTTVDLHDALAWLERTNRDRAISDRVLPAALILKGVVAALADQPRLNGWWIDDELRAADRVDVGVGVALRGGGLIAPVIPAAEQLDVVGVMDALRSIVGRARSGHLKGTDLGEASLTVTNLGDQGVEVVYGVIAPPQVAVVGVGAIVERPWAVDGMLTVRPLVTLTLSADHRATDGHEGARFLTAIAHRLNEPETL